MIDRVDHTYRDYSGFAPTDAEKKRFGQKKQEEQSHPHVCNAREEQDLMFQGKNFPQTLHKILSCEEMSHIISWMPHGRAWKVFTPAELETQAHYARTRQELLLP
eukprot:15354605-Ditylum_brightwellii.AAC.1